MAVDSLAPYPGSKRDKKYDLLRSNGLPRLCEPFMGGAATSIITRKRSTLGEINPWMRAIAHAPLRSNRKAFAESYREARQLFLRIDRAILAEYQGRKQKKAQTAMKAEYPEIYADLNDRWGLLLATLWEAEPSDNAGLYAFCQRAAFGNVMRTNPTGTAFNVGWHIQKIPAAIKFSPEDFCNALRAWRPVILDSWQAAIWDCPRPKETHLLLDPPYWVDGKKSKMTPCYPGHDIGTIGDHDATYRLAIDPLQAGLERSFPLIHLCNYYSDRLQTAVIDLAFAYGYSVQRFDLGLCRALGNSNGRHKHGDRVDGRDRPSEVIYQLKPGQLALF